MSPHPPVPENSPCSEPLSPGRTESLPTVPYPRPSLRPSRPDQGPRSCLSPDNVPGSGVSLPLGPATAPKGGETSNPPEPTGKTYFSTYRKLYPREPFFHTPCNRGRKGLTAEGAITGRGPLTETVPGATLSDKESDVRTLGSRSPVLSPSLESRTTVVVVQVRPPTPRDSGTPSRHDKGPTDSGLPETRVRG